MKKLWTKLFAAAVALTLSGSVYGFVRSPQDEKVIQTSHPSINCQSYKGEFVCNMNPAWATVTATGVRFILGYTTPDYPIEGVCSQGYCSADRVAFFASFNGRRSTDSCAPYTCPPADACSKHADGVERCLFKLA